MCKFFQQQAGKTYCFIMLLYFTHSPILPLKFLYSRTIDLLCREEDCNWNLATGPVPDSKTIQGMNGEDHACEWTTNDVKGTGQGITALKLHSIKDIGLAVHLYSVEGRPVESLMGTTSDDGCIKIIDISKNAGMSAGISRVYLRNIYFFSFHLFSYLLISLTISLLRRATWIRETRR